MTHGTIVECIDDHTFPEQYLGIKKGAQYCVRWYGQNASYLGGNYMGVKLVGIHRGICPQFGEDDPPFDARRFRVVSFPKVEGKVKEEELT